MTSRFFCLFLFILLGSSIDQTGSMNFDMILRLTSSSGKSPFHEQHARVVKRSVARNFHDINLKSNSVAKVKIANYTQMNNMTLGSNSTLENRTEMMSGTPIEAGRPEEPIDPRECDPCVVWAPKPEDEEDSAYHPNLTIIPMGGVFMYMVCLVIKFIHWCNEDIRLADERFMKISVPVYVTPSNSPQVSPAKHYPSVRRVHRRSSVSVANARLIQKAKHILDDETSNTDETLSEDITVIYNDNFKKPVPTAAAPIGKSMSQKMGLTRSPNRYLRRQSMHSSNTTLSSSLSSHSPSGRTRNISFQDTNECSSPSSLSHGHAESYLDITPLIRHSKSSETPFTHRKLSFRTHLLTPPLLHFQVSSVDTSTTSLGESIPSLASKPSMSESAMTEQLCISEDNESCSSDACLGACSSFSSHKSSHLQQKGGMMFLAGSYYEDPLIIECSYVEVDETMEHSDHLPTKFTLGSRSPSPESASCDAQPPRDATLEDVRQEDDGDNSDDNDDTDRPQMTISEGSDSSDCNSESELTANHHEEEEFPKSSESTSHCSSPGVYAGMDPSLYYKLSVESNASTGSLQSPESLQSDSTSVCSSEVALLRRVNPSVAFRALNTKSHPPRRERISLNGMTYFSQHGGRRIQNGKVMRMCRSWCLGDKASAIYGQLRRGLLEKECYM